MVAPRRRLEFIVELGLSATVLVAPLTVEPQEGYDDQTEKNDGEYEVGKPEQNGGEG